jgi:hypothetical protein
VSDEPQYLRRRPAARYLNKTYGFGSESTLAKGVVTGDTPAYQKVGSRIVLYTKEALDEWAMAKIGTPRRSSSDDSSGRGKPRRAVPKHEA